MTTEIMCVIHLIIIDPSRRNEDKLIAAGVEGLRVREWERRSWQSLPNRHRFKHRNSTFNENSAPVDDTWSL